MIACTECQDRLVRAATDDPSQTAEQSELHGGCARALALYAGDALRQGSPDRLPRRVRVALLHARVLASLEARR